MSRLAALWRDYLLALSFLTRLAPPRAAPPGAFVRTLALFPLVGLALGGLTVAPFALGFLSGHPLVAAWAWAGLDVWCTRGLHLDGLADVADAWGSGARGERFYAILKDSRCGAFAVMGLVLALGGRVLCGAEALAAGDWGLLVFTPVLGRTLAACLGVRGRELVRPGLGAGFLTGARGRDAWIAALGCLVLGLALVPVAKLLAGIALAAVAGWLLLRLARDRGGLNGDFLGAAVVAGELAALLGGVAAG